MSLVPFFRPSKHHHHNKQWARKPRHQYQQPVMFPIDMSRIDYRTHRHGKTRGKGSMYTTVLNDMLKLHNYHRARHCAPPLTISQRLNQIAQSYAEQLAATLKFEHSGNQLGNEKLGENLYTQWISHGKVSVDARDAIKSWYDEIDLYDYNDPKFSHEAGHFTQLVWKSSRKLGVGVALSADKRHVYMVTNYYPAGNIMNPGYFERNVLPPNC